MAVLRRSDRAQGEAWIREALLRATHGVFTIAHEGRPEGECQHLRHDEESDSIYLHSAAQGRTRALMERDRPAAFMVSALGRFLPGVRPLEFSAEFASVVVYGLGQVVRDAAETRRAFDLMMEKYAPHLKEGEDYGSTTARDLGRTAAYRIRIERWGGKQNVEDPGFPGAYTLPGLSVPVRTQGP